MSHSRQPIPGVLTIQRGDRVRVTTGVVIEPTELPGEEAGMVRATTTGWAKADPEYVDGKWVLDVAGVGIVPVGNCKRA